jgi:hypothetical protein
VLVALLFATSVAPVAAEELGADTGEVTFRVTLSGPVDDRDGFLIFTRCGDEWCDAPVSEAYPEGQTVYACAKGLADQVPCEATTYEWTVELATGPLEYDFVRNRDVFGDQEHQVLHSGSWVVHSGEQVLSFAYAYPSNSAGPTLPDTAVPAP